MVCELRVCRYSDDDSSIYKDDNSISKGLAIFNIRNIGERMDRNRQEIIVNCISRVVSCGNTKFNPKIHARFEFCAICKM